jgi:pimeloyl-ACP methyl ester carboxylesterase
LGVHILGPVHAGGELLRAVRYGTSIRHSSVASAIDVATQWVSLIAAKSFHRAKMPLIHHVVTGNAQPPIVFVHGFACNHSDWDQQVTHFSPPPDRCRRSSRARCEPWHGGRVLG